SKNAIRYALEYFETEPCKFIILNVQKVSSFVTDDLMAMHPSDTIFKSLIESSKQKVVQFIKELKETYNNTLHQFESKVDYDNFIDAINQVIELEGIELIVMGTKGASNIAKTIFGSNAARVIQRANCPVLAIPNDYTFNGIKHIAFPSNYFTEYNIDDLKPLLALTNKTDSKVSVLHVKDEEHLSEYQENNRAFLDQCFSNQHHEFIDLEQGNLFKKITNYIVENDVDLLAMMSRKHSFIERVFARHAAESFAFNPKVPLLVMENTGNFYLK
ncbi:MAG: universal stress protein, partial [Psychroserpens sp.]|nr:universal stress protein [Psychroserpens sp.]